MLYKGKQSRREWPVQPADTERCSFSNEIYQVPDVSSYKDVCQRFSRVRPAPCQSPGEVLFYCLTPIPPPPHHKHHLFFGLLTWQLQHIFPSHTGTHSQGQCESLFYEITKSLNTKQMSRGEEVHQILYIQSNLTSINFTAGIIFVGTKRQRVNCSYPKSSLNYQHIFFSKRHYFDNK